MNILSIESSCDDSSIALTKNKNLIWHKKISQESSHSPFGGVVPELASRLFAKDLPILLSDFKNEIGFDKLDIISVTNEPGLSTSLLEGVIMAKALSLSLKIPLIPINHLKGHIYSLFIDKEEIMPLSVLLVSGGHSMIIECYDYSNVKIFARTLDDSFGECYDKAAKMLGLGYPGGSIIDSLAQQNNEKEMELPIPLSNQDNPNFSFSGLKNAFRLKLQENKDLCNLINLAQKNNAQDSILQIKNNSFAKRMAAGLQRSAVSHLIEKCKKYLKNCNHIKHFAIVGGASANSLLRYEAQKLADEFNKILILSELKYCSDNAAMIGRATMPKIKCNPQILNNYSIDINVSPKSTEF